MKRLILLIAGLLLCVGCDQVDTSSDTLVIQQEPTTRLEYLKGDDNYTKIFPEGYKYFIQHVETLENEYFVTGVIESDGNISSMFVWDRSYPDYIYKHWLSNGHPDLGLEFKDLYDSMIDCFDNNADTCEIYPAQ